MKRFKVSKYITPKKEYLTVWEGLRGMKDFIMACKRGFPIWLQKGGLFSIFCIILNKEERKNYIKAWKRGLLIREKMKKI